jgi:hypothetical protein
MDKIKDFIAYNKKDILVMFAVSFTMLFCLFGGIFVFQKTKEHFALEAAQKACDEAYKMMCVQVHTCTGTAVITCDNLVSELHFCEKQTFPSVEVIRRCTEQLRHADCTSELPLSCQSFMD